VNYYYFSTIVETYTPIIVSISDVPKEKVYIRFYL